MNKKITSVVFSLMLFAFAGNLMAQDGADDISIKGVRVGMSRGEFVAKFGGTQVNAFTVGRAGNIYPIKPEFKDDVLVDFTMFFKSSSFDDVLGAVKEKYPKMICAESKTANTMGTVFKQVDCAIDGKNPPSSLMLRRFVGDIRTSALMLISKEELDSINKRAAERKKDI